MADDLLDARAAVEWAITQVPILQERIQRWRNSKPYTLRIDSDSEPGKKLYRIADIQPLDPVINTEAGAIINSIRSSLDLLANALAARAGNGGKTDVYFPICNNLAHFLDEKKGGGMEKIKWLREADKSVIKDLQPYLGGHNLLYALHKLDITRKHQRLLDILIFPRGVGLDGLRHEDIHFVVRAGILENETVVAWTDATVADGDLTLGLQVGFREAGPVEGRQVTGTLREFSGAALAVINLFE